MSPFGTHLLDAAAAAGFDAETLRVKAVIHDDDWREIIDGARKPAQSEMEALARVLAGRDGTAYERHRRAMAKAAGLIS